MKDPKDAVIRLCQECTNPMKLQNYEFDIEYRWYEFYCKNCGYTVHLGESIEQYIRKWHQKSGELLEPLTKEELKKQAFEENV